MNIKERLDNLKIRIQQPDFLKGEGLSNEVGIWFFCYNPKDEMVVRNFTDKLVTSQSLSCHLVEKNLYSILLDLCDDLDISDSIADMENAEGKVFLLEQLYSAIGVNEYISKIQFEPQVRGRDVLLLTGVHQINELNKLAHYIIRKILVITNWNNAVFIGNKMYLTVKLLNVGIMPRLTCKINVGVEIKLTASIN